MQFTITEEEMQRVLDASKPVPYILGTGGVEPTSPQARANAAWQAIGKAHGIDWMSIRPVNEAARIMSGTAVDTRTDVAP